VVLRAGVVEKGGRPRRVGVGSEAQSRNCPSTVAGLGQFLKGQAGPVTNTLPTTGDVYATTDADDALIQVAATQAVSIPTWVLNAKISHRAFRLYAILVTFGGGELSRKALAGLLQCSPRTVDVALNELIAIQALEVTFHYLDNGSQIASTYTVFGDAPGHQRGVKDTAVGPSQPTATHKSKSTSTTGSKEKSTPLCQSAAPSAPELDRQFEKTWAPYPRKVRKGPAKVAYLTLRKTGADPWEIYDAVVNYAKAYEDKAPAFILHGSTFFAKDRWRDWLPGGAAMQEAATAGDENIEFYDAFGKPVYK